MPRMAKMDETDADLRTERVRVIEIKGRVYTKLAGIWYKAEGEVQRNAGKELGHTLDVLWMVRYGNKSD